MQNKRPLTIEEIREKFLYLSGGEPKKNLNESVVTSNNTSKLLKYEKMADGKVYGIVQEGQKFYVKVCSAPTTNTLNVSDFVYLGGSMVNEKLYERFESYNKALNRFHGKKVALNETFGRLNENADCDTTDKPVNESESDKDVVNTNPDSKRRSIKVTFDNGDTINTEINGTEDTIKKYYVGKEFNLGNGEKDKMVKGTKVEFLGEVNEGEVNEEIPLNKDIDAKKGETIVPAPAETPAPTTPVETLVTPEVPAAEPTVPTEAKPEGGEPAPDASTEPQPVDNTDIADYNPENPTAPAAPSTDSAPVDAPVSDVNTDAPVSADSTDSESGDTVSEIQSLLGKLGAEFRKLPEVDAATTKSAINNIISATKSGIEKLDDSDKEEIKKRIDKNGEKMDEEVESTDDELDAETINEVAELCGVDNEDMEEKLNEAIKTPYGRFLVKKLIKEEMSRYQSDNINEESNLVEPGTGNGIKPGKLKEGEKYTWFMGAEPLECTFIEADDDYRFIFKLGNSTHKLSMKDVKDYIYPHYVFLEYNKTSKNIGESTDDKKDNATEPVQESKYQKYLAAKKNKLAESDSDDSLEVGKEYKTDSNLGGIFNVVYKGKSENGNHNFEVSKGEFKGQTHSVKPENLSKYLVK